MARQLTYSAMAALSFAVPQAVHGQTFGSGMSVDIAPTLDRGDVAGSRAEPTLQPLSHRVGPVLVRPAFGLVSGYEDNVLYAPDARGDAILVVAPRLDLVLDDPRHDLALTVAGTARRFARMESQNSEEFLIQSANRLDVAPDLEVRLGADLSRRVEPRNSAGTILDALEPVSYDRLGAETSLTLAIGTLDLTMGGAVERVTYNPLTLRAGGEDDQSFRDLRTIGGNVRLGYDLSGFMTAFAEVHASTHHSLHPIEGRARDSRGLNMVAGLKGAVSALVSLEVALGYQLRDYREDIYRDFSGASFVIKGEWYPTPFVTAQFGLSRHFRNSGNRNVAAILEDGLSASLFYDPTRQLRFALTGDVQHDRYRDTTTRAWRKQVTFKVNYQINRAVALGAQIHWLDQTVSGAPLVNAFKGFGGGVGITVTP
ncbi:outer membrane beta-barrel protein [Novosphingobium sp. 1949]|uniref:Outer membrane beta-barrel protein n=1 Tax=Novosphingobium organovorum TaxID=2930092 RepID=A0ABT0BDZ4_9SPHN|nr:outer membrane beta-barrel protein [Novosphingobium organovorum]MCJ2183291.1 outer membrane beta-barrel protein [Novosphingobium organovorum]